MLKKLTDVKNGNVEDITKREMFHIFGGACSDHCLSDCGYEPGLMTDDLKNSNLKPNL